MTSISLTIEDETMSQLRDLAEVSELAGPEAYVRRLIDQDLAARNRAFEAEIVRRLEHGRYELMTPEKSQAMCEEIAARLQASRNK